MKFDQSHNANANQTPPSSQIDHVIGVMSAKGGVGKSFVAGLLACELVRQGYRVGVLDADFTAPSIPLHFGLHGPLKVGTYSFIPMESRSGVRVISMDLMVDNEEQSVIWKESLMGNVVEELWKNVEWGGLDYLLVDLPPATTESSIAMTQLLPLTGVIIVTTPQLISATMARRAVAVVQKTGIPVLGIVENFSGYRPGETGQEELVFGNSHFETVTRKAGAPLLVRIPLTPSAAELCDAGRIEDILLDESALLANNLTRAAAEAREKQAAAANNIALETAGPDTAIEADPLDPGYPVDEMSCAQTADVCNPFSDTVMHLIRSRENMGAMDHPDSQGFFIGRCGDRMQIDLRIIKDRIIEAKFVPEGCGATLAAGSMLTKMACTKTLEEAREITPDELVAALDGLPDDHLHCAELAVMTLREAVIDAVESFGKPLRKE